MSRRHGRISFPSNSATMRSSGLKAFYQGAKAHRLATRRNRRSAIIAEYTGIYSGEFRIGPQETPFFRALRLASIADHISNSLTAF
jgi:hypothetical protein